ncbi:glycosyltransferase family 4 protein [Rummeliibacillus sp. SL167]|uniref:glycosyltransferase family 4 protein n=1 Tax=Rummeliibacillus sp. SL167 TaxID=2579792 RepID=UPI0021052A73|nr:glycosyltransferase family 4 protein [Rummeliibacillus sp. SL167]
MSKSRILIITQNFYPEIGSHANRMTNLFQLLKQEGYDVSVLTTEPSYPNKHIYEDKKFWDNKSLDNEEKIHRVKVKNRKYALNMLNRLIHYLEISMKMLLFILFQKQKFDIVLVTTPAIFIAFVGLIAKLRYRAKFILDVRDLWPESLKGVGVFDNALIIKFFSLLEIFLYKKSNHIIINSIGFKDYIVKKAKINPDKITYLPNAARLYELQPAYKFHKNFRVIYTGNIGLAQDVEFLKDLIRKLDKQHIQITIVGYGQKKNDLIHFIKENRLHNVSIVNPTTRAECLALNAKHDVGILSLNNNEVFETVLPGKLIDYMMSGIPVVAAVSGYSKEIIETYQTGFVSEKRDAYEIVKKILLLKYNPDLREKTASNGLKLIQSHFIWEKNIKILTSLLKEEPSAEPIPLLKRIDKDIKL